MNNAKQMYRIYNEAGEYIEVAESAGYQDGIDISNNDSRTLLAFLTVEMAEDFRDCLDELIGKIQRGE